MKKIWLILLLVTLGVTSVIFWRGRPGTAASKTEGRAPQAIAVVIGEARRMDVPVWLTGIGTVQASNTVTVRPRVSGSLDQVHFTEGALVKQGDVLARIDPRPYESILAQAEAKKAQDKAQLMNARLEADRFRNLLKDDAVSQQQADQATASVAQLEALVQADDAAISAAKLDLEFTTVRAPISGRTGIRLVDAGNIVTSNQGEGLVVLTEIQPISVMFTLPQQHLAALSAAAGKSSEPLTTEALGESDTVLDNGTLQLIDNQIDTSTGTLKLKAAFPNEKLSLWPGQFVSARVLVETRKDAVVVPREAVQPGIDGPFCYVVKADDTVEARSVRSGISTDQGLVIEEGLSAGEKIVVTGQIKLHPGAKVAAQGQAS